MDTVTLYGWRTPTDLIPGTDHTWVTTYPSPYDVAPELQDHYWYCWGIAHPADTGLPAEQICVGTADAQTALCIARPGYRHAWDVPGGIDWEVYAGIELYGVEGVCHQVSNRILYACSAYGSPPTVSGSRGYRVSLWLYGTYGRIASIDWKKRRARCSALADEPLPTLIEALALDASGKQQQDEWTLGLQQIRARHLTMKHELDIAVMAGDLNGREYAQEVNEMVSARLPEVNDVLGDSGQEMAFGMKTGASVQIVDPRIAAEFDEQVGYRRNR